jgi:hypothetical protein
VEILARHPAAARKERREGRRFHLYTNKSPVSMTLARRHKGPRGGIRIAAPCIRAKAGGAEQEGAGFDGA